MFHLKNFFSLLVLVLAMLVSTSVSQAAPSGQTVTATGVLSVVWGDPKPGSTQLSTTRYFLTDDRGVMTEVLINEDIVRVAGGVLALDRQRVTLVGADIVRAQGELPRLRVQAIQHTERVEQAALAGAQPWISIGCKFADVPYEPKSLAYLQSMYAGNYPGLNHYWREQSYNKINLMGSGAVGWFTMAQPKAYYTNPDGSLKILSIAQDCAIAADAAVTFSNYVGVNFMYNDTIGGYSYGTSGLSIYFNGGVQLLRATWLLPWAYQSLTATEHEMGHGFGLPHSSGNYGQTYDNQWDVMSDMWSNCGRSSDPTFGCLGQHTIAFHKSILGWITPLWLQNGSKTLDLERIALPPTSNYQAVEISIGGSASHFYTVEVRRRAGYDVKLPGEGVIIHEVDTTRGNPARVVDMDNNGNTGDAGAIWGPGEVFADPTNQIYVCIKSQTASGYRVTVARGVKPTCASIPTPTNTPRPGNVIADSATARDAAREVRTTFKVGDMVWYYGWYYNSSGQDQWVKFSHDVVGPCGSIYHWQEENYASWPEGYHYSDTGNTIPPDACPGMYTYTFGVTYNALTTASTTFTVVAAPTPTQTGTSTPTQTTTATPTPDGDWIYCAGENKTCTLPGTRLVRYGANTSYKYKTLSGSFVCIPMTFGGDPLPGVGKHCDYHINPNQPTPTFTPTKVPLRTKTFTPTATRTRTLTPTRTTTATRTRTATATATGTQTRTRTATRTPSVSYTPGGDWIYCAGENKTCTLRGTRLVRYGANTSYKYKTLSGSFVCQPATFGGDPLPGVGKHCDYHINPNQPTPTFTPTKVPLRTQTFTPTATRTQPPAAACGAKPAAPQLLRPKAGAVIEKAQATLKWEAAECADTYLVIIREAGSKEQIERKAGLPGLTYETRKLEAGHTYEWQVLAVNGHGRTSSEMRRITLQ